MKGLSRMRKSIVTGTHSNTSNTLSLSLTLTHSPRTLLEIENRNAKSVNHRSAYHFRSNWFSVKGCNVMTEAPFQIRIGSRWRVYCVRWSNQFVSSLSVQAYNNMRGIVWTIVTCFEDKLLVCDWNRRWRFLLIRGVSFLNQPTCFHIVDDGCRNAFLLARFRMLIV